MIHFPKTTLFQINSQSFKQNPIIRWRLVNEIKTKNKKKEGKGKFQVYKKASSSLRFLIKSPPITVRNNIQFRLHAHTSDDVSGSILSKKLAFLKPSTWTNGFLFFPFFSFEKFNGRSVAKHIGLSTETLWKIENLTHF